MNNDEKILDLLETIAIKVKSIDERLVNVEGAVVRIENEHGAKLGALYDGYLSNKEILEEIKTEVTKHEDIILRRVF